VSPPWRHAGGESSFPPSTIGPTRGTSPGQLGTLSGKLEVHDAHMGYIEGQLPVAGWIDEHTVPTHNHPRHVNRIVFWRLYDVEKH